MLKVARLGVDHFGIVTYIGQLSRTLRNLFIL